MNPVETISLDPRVPEISFIMQTKLPAECIRETAGTVERLAEAIRRLDIRGAPALGIAGAYGVALSALIRDDADHAGYIRMVKEDADYLKGTRPTAVNLFYGIDRVLKVVIDSPDTTSARNSAIHEAVAVADEDRETCHAIGDHGNGIVPDSCTILTHCNAGALACREWGTALGVIRSAAESGKKIRVYACETRPLLQGARLTSWELARDGIDVTVITDSMAASLMRKKMIDLVIVGADRITRDAVFNKIGTYMHAVCSQMHQIPFYVAAPLSTFDEDAREEDICVEERSRDEIAEWGGRITVPDEVPVYNPAFDATPVGMVTGIITEHGILHLPEDIPRIKALRQDQTKGPGM